jgi:hypothetical protein
MDKHPDLAIFANTVNYHCEIRLDGIESIGYRAQMPFDGIHAEPQTFPILRDWFGQLWWSTSAQHRVDMLRMPTQRDRKRLQSPRASSSLDDVMLDFADGRPRNMRTVRKLTLPPAEFIHPFVDGCGHGRPVLHLFLRAPPRRRD